MVDFYGIHVGKYTSPMNAMGIEFHSLISLVRGRFQMSSDLNACLFAEKKTQSMAKL